MRAHTHTQLPIASTCVLRLRALPEPQSRAGEVTTPSHSLSLDIEEGTVVAGFGAVRQLQEGEEARRTRLGYSFIVKEREGIAS